jgi:uncharacterized protein (DUF952 family)
MTTHRLFHLVPEDRWRETAEHVDYAPDSLVSEGFIHLSTADQVAGTAERFFAGVEDLLVLEVTIADDDPYLRWEPAVGPRGLEDFPHYHHRLPLARITAASRWRSGEDQLGRES